MGEGLWEPQTPACTQGVLPEVGVRAGLGEAASQVLEVSAAEHAVLEEGQLPEEHLRQLGQRCGPVGPGRRVLLQQGEGEAADGQTQQGVGLHLLGRAAVRTPCQEEDSSLHRV